MCSSDMILKGAIEPCRRVELLSRGAILLVSHNMHAPIHGGFGCSAVEVLWGSRIAAMPHSEHLQRPLALLYRSAVVILPPALGFVLP